MIEKVLGLNARHRLRLLDHHHYNSFPQQMPFFFLEQQQFSSKVSVYFREVLGRVVRHHFCSIVRALI